MLVNYNDIWQYQNCPVLFREFNTPEEDRRSLMATTLQSCMRYLFFRELELGYYPDFRSIIRYLSSKSRLLTESGFTTSQFNNITSSLNEAYIFYKEKFYDNGYRVVALNVDAFVSSGTMTYAEKIPAIVATPNKTLVPIYFIVDRGYIRKNNYTRFSSAVLENLLEVPVKKYIAIRIDDASRGAIDISQHTVPEKGNRRAMNDLQNILKQIERKIEAPNTNYCPQCPFIKTCKV